MGDDGRGSADSGPAAHWQVEVDADTCSLCEVCARDCELGALRSEQREDTLFLVFEPKLCPGCRACLEHCPEDAIKLVQVETADDRAEPEVVMQSRMLHCATCGSYFAPVRKLEAAERKLEEDRDLIREQCPLCRRTQMVARFIDEKREAKGRPAEYLTGRKWIWKAVAPGDPDGPPCPETQGP